MTTATLTEDQRLLLSQVWPGRMAGVFLTPDTEIPALHRSRAGGCWPARPNLPDWFRSYDCTAKGIVGGPINEPPHTIVTWAQLGRFVRSVPADLIAELRAADRDWRNPKRCRDALLAVLGLGVEVPVQLELFEAAR